jgi:hypothetical protein
MFLSLYSEKEFEKNISKKNYCQDVFREWTKLLE